LKVLQTANLGRSVGGISGSIRYALYDTLGSEVSSSANTGIYELGSTTGIYGVELNLSPQFSGSIVWSVTSAPSIFATEEVKIDQKMARYIHTGRWTVDSSTNQMVFFQDDNTTVIARYNLFDSSGSPSVTEVFDRVYSGSV
jgi:hypothetical protein|tara:strand:- start:1575 stop:2000 length:426 start_codon:yes stop_codon:yes gene_type:complete